MKKFLQKRLSVFLALLMVFSMFAFTPEMFTKAEAATDYTNQYGQYKVRMRILCDGNWWYCDACSVYVLYKTQKGTTSKKAKIASIIKDNFKEGKNKTFYLGNPNSSAGGDDPSGRDGVLIDGFPVGWDFSEMKNTNKCDDAPYRAYIDVWNYKTNGWTEVFASSKITVSNGSNFAKQDNQAVKYPQANELTWNPGNAGSIMLKNDSSVLTATGTAAPVIKDQYGVVLPYPTITYTLYDAETGGNVVNNSGITVATSSSRTPTISASKAAADWVLAGGDISRDIYAVANCDGLNSGTDRYKVTISNYTVNVTYDLNGGEYWGTEDDKKTEASEKVNYGGYLVDIPTAAYKKGHTFKGIFTTATGGTAVTKTTQIKDNKTYYAQWTPIDNPVEFYNSNGQLIRRYTPKYGTTIGSAGAPSTPTYPGKTQAINGTYVFENWIVWDAPEAHADWVGTGIDKLSSAKLDSENPDEVLKFIATYKLGDDATVKTYTANFYNAGGGKITAASGSYAYWTQVKIFGIGDEGSEVLEQGSGIVTEANGFELDRYSYTFVGWTTQVPEGDNKWFTEDAVEYTSADIFRIKENVNFYPCYSKTIKQCTVTKGYYYLSNTGTIRAMSEEIKGIDTELGKTFDLGAADPFSFNLDGYTYTFKGWKKIDNIDNAINQGEGTPDVEYKSGKAETVLEGDVIYFAVYEKTEIKYNTYYYNGTQLLKDLTDLSRFDDNSTLIEYSIADQFDLETPERERTGQTGYRFVGWVEDPAKVLVHSAADLVTSYTFGEQSKSFYAAYDSYSYYTVTFRNDEGDTLQTSKDYVAGDVIAYTAAAPAENAEMFIPVVENKASGVQYQYTFMGWRSNDDSENVLEFEDDTAGTVKYAVAPGEGNNITVTKDTVYTAVFKKEIREYKISLYAIGVNPDLKVNADGYGCYTNEGSEYFVKNDAIFTKNGDEYVAYEGSLKIGDLEAVKADAIAVLTLKYGENILDAVKALYNGASTDAEVSQIADTTLQIIPYGETELTAIPYSTDQYSYSFNGWSPAINPNMTVTGDAAYVATYRTENVIYNVHWYVPTEFENDPVHEHEATAFSEQITTYRYHRAISIPAKTPTSVAPDAAEHNNYEWKFIGWYECDADKNIKKDSEGKDVKYSKGTLVDPGDNHNRDFYYVAKFAYVANDYTVKVYSETGGVLLGTYKGAYDTDISITNYRQNPNDNYHYVLDAFTDIDGNVITEAEEGSLTTYTITGNVDLYVRYKAVSHIWSDWKQTEAPTYVKDGEEERKCDDENCTIKQKRNIDKLVDDCAPEGKVIIKSYVWDATSGAAEAFVRADSIISVMAVDCGANGARNEGNGIKSIVCTWSNGAEGDSIEFNEFEKTSYNFDIQLPTGDSYAAGMALTAVITDWIGETYTITTGGLYTDTVKPVIEPVKEKCKCDGFGFTVTEDHLMNITVTAVIPAEAYAAAGGMVTADEEKVTRYIVLDENGTVTDDNFTDTEAALRDSFAAYIIDAPDSAEIPAGVYTVKASDKAGNSATVTFEITNEHEWNDGKISQPRSCSDDEMTDYVCVKCGAEKTKKTNDSFGGHLAADEYTVTREATCTDAGEMILVCAREGCGEVLETRPIKAESELGHDYQQVTVPATCKAEGSKFNKCFVCGEIEENSTEVITQLTHVVDLTAEGADAEGWIVKKAATCTKSGERYQICSLCGEKCSDPNMETIPAPGHTFKDITPDGDYCETAVVAGANTNTYHLFKCDICGYLYEFNTAAKTHTPTMDGKEKVYEVTVEPTCDKNGEKVNKCKVCDKVLETVRIGKNDHVKGELIQTLTAPTCTNEGSGIFECAVCHGEGVKVYGTIPALGHDYVETVIEATCAEAGYTEITCTRCSYKETKDVTEATGNHTAVKHDAVAETCTAEGGTEYYECSVCGKFFSDEACTAEITKDSWIVPAKAHTPTMNGEEKVYEVTLESTCAKEGKKVNKCAVCGEVLETVKTEKKAHTQGNLITTKTAATCVADGEDVYMCTVCNDSFPVPIPADGTSHNWGAFGAWKTVTPATCTEKGIEKAVRVCTYKDDGCTAEDVKTRETAALGHNYKKTGESDPVTVDGVTTVTITEKCDNCGDIKTTTVETTLHTVTIGSFTINDVTYSGASIDLRKGEKLTEAKIEEALGSLPTPSDIEEGQDGVNVIEWKLGGETITLPAEVKADAELTAVEVFVPNTYVVTFYDATGKIITQESYLKGETVTVPDDLYVSGYRFQGWTDGATNYAPSAIPAVTASVGYTPWLISNDNYATYYVTFKNDTGSKTLHTETIECDKGDVISFSLPAFAEPTKAGNTVYHYVFNGWVDANGNPATFPVEISGNVTYKASFTAVAHADSNPSAVVTPASCTTAEITTYVCSCGHTWDGYTAPAAGHSYIEVDRVTDGNTTSISYFCTVCGDEYTRTVTAGSQADVIVVRVTDGTSPVSDATVTVYISATKTLEAKTDANGNAYFSKDNLPDGTYQAKVTKDNYNTATGQMTVKNGTGSVKLTVTRQPCHCVCHSNSFFGNIRRFFNKIMRLFNKNYTCCSCGECEKIY